MTSFLLRCVLATALLLPAVSFADPPKNYPFVDYDTGLRAAQKSGKPIFLYFGRLGCGWCDKTNKEAFSQAEVRKRYIGNFELVYVDAEGGKRLKLPSGERITEMELGARFKAFATPLFAYLKPDGELIFKISGIQSGQDFLTYDRFITGGFYKTQTIREYLAQ